MDNATDKFASVIARNAQQIWQFLIIPGIIGAFLAFGIFIVAPEIFGLYAKGYSSVKALEIGYNNAIAPYREIFTDNFKLGEIGIPAFGGVLAAFMYFICKGEKI
jgi:hypothetical protein